MRMIYVDYENVQSTGLDGIEHLKVDDNIFLLYSTHAETMKMKTVQKLLDSLAEINFIEVETGSMNALDFQLVAVLFMGIEMENDYFIISRDSGFDPAIHFGINHGYSIKRFGTLKDLLASEAAEENAEVSENPSNVNLITESSDMDEYSLIEILPENAETTRENSKLSMVEIIIEEKCGRQVAEQYGNLVITGLKQSNNKNQFYQFFRTNLGDIVGGDLYRSIRSKYDEMKSVMQ